MNRQPVRVALVLSAALLFTALATAQDGRLDEFRRRARELLPGLKARSDEATVAFERELAPAWEDYLKANPGLWDGELFVNVAYGYYFTGRLDRCQAHLEPALSSAGALTPQADLLYVMLLTAQRRYGRARAEADFLVGNLLARGVEDLPPADARLYMLARGGAALHCGGLDDAAAQFEAVLAHTPDALSAAEARRGLADVELVRLMLGGGPQARGAYHALRARDAALACLAMTCADKGLAAACVQSLKAPLEPALAEFLSGVILNRVADDEVKARLRDLIGK